ncbi:CDP-diacylglycerol--glycerol-3-phosphate 3-phosphatidyltransferase [Corynebacterium epidermidicanis]|uniref:CDP-diacylglycerol--glycerol-3-phosphate 3-phosphatidyltransferase n=2 Tax=Corynebacterium epidermidicanis TaxID=1050174 RepID=A0A0G3GQ66_9CORY|nr:CDP-diacylglycerol--glycerol-3-phosphate 3-phosphatidyltransferase [Corynebacterium epidermidicanis]
MRIIAVPLFVWLVLKGNHVDHRWMWWSFVCFVGLMITDKLDGDIARKHNLVTNFGKIADPIADKALMISAFVSLNIVVDLPVWITVVVVVRELGITLWRMVQLRSGRVVPASKGGKLKTALQSLAIALFLIPAPSWAHWPIYAVMYAAVLVTVVTGVQYVWDSRKANNV